MTAVNIDALRRQMENKRNGLTRRLALIDDALRKVDRVRARANAARAKLDEELADLEAQEAALLALRQVHGVNKQKGASSETAARLELTIIDSDGVADDLRRRNCVSDGEVLIIDGAFPQILTENAMVWETPLAFPDGPTREVSTDKLGPSETTFGRAVAIPGFAHLGYLVQAQWMTDKPLAAAVASSERRGNYGEALAPDLIGHIVDGKAAGVGGEQFWKERRLSGGDDRDAHAADAEAVGEPDVVKG